MMKKLICFCLIVMLIVPTFCYADVASFLRWGLSKDDVILLMGKPDQTYDYSELEEYDYKNQSISAFTCTMSLIFRNGALIGRAYMLTDSNEKEKYTYLCNAIESKYGVATNNISIITDIVMLMVKSTGEEAIKTELESMIQSLIETGNVKSWTISSDTAVVIIFAQGESSSQITLFYFQPTDQTPEYNYNGL